MESAERKGLSHSLDECLSVRGGELYVERCRARDLADRFGTPLYVMSEDQLRRNTRRYQVAFGSRWPGEVLLLPSIKANQSLALRRILTDEGAGCDVFGLGELEAALRTGTPPGWISLNGPMKTPDLLERAVRAGARITLDSRAELGEAIAAAERIGERAEVRFRLRPDLVGFDQASEMSTDGTSIRDALQRYKAGIPTEDLLGIDPEIIGNPAINVTGVHLHLGRHSADPELWSGAIDFLTGMLALLRERWDGWTPGEIDLGGGFPAPRDPFGRLLAQRLHAPERSPGADDFASVICARLAARLGEMDIDPAAVRLELEPGRAIYADAGVHLSTIGNVKRQSEPVPLTWVETDSSDAYLPDVNLEFNRWICVAVDQADAVPVIVADVTGRTCALDVIRSSAELPEVQAGDVLAFLDTGAYQDAGAHNFNALPRPGTVLVNGGEAEMIRAHETIGDVFARDIVPERLSGNAEPGPPAGSRVTGLDHFSVTTSNLDRSLEFYNGLLGIPIRARGESDGSDEFAIAGMSESDVRWADLDLRHGQIIELIEYDGGRSETSLAAPGISGATHLALRVPEVDLTFERLRAAGVTVKSEPVTIETPGAWKGSRAFYAIDPDGVTVEMIQSPAPPVGR